jgi:hypothetical protein
MNLFKTSGADYVHLDQVTRFECDADQITLHFDGENQVTLRDDDAKKLMQILAKISAEFEGRSLPR